MDYGVPCNQTEIAVPIPSCVGLRRFVLQLWPQAAQPLTPNLPPDREEGTIASEHRYSKAGEVAENSGVRGDGT